MIEASPTQSRAVLRPIEAGSNVYCAHCDVHLKFLSPLQHPDYPDA